MTSISPEKITTLLQQSRLVELFNELGWEHVNNPLIVAVGDQIYTLEPIAQKKGVQVYCCKAPGSARIPPYAHRQKIERAVNRQVREHLVIYVDSKSQVWQWVERAPQKPASYREITYYTHQSGELLRQKLSRIAFTLEDEKTLDDVGVFMVTTLLKETFGTRERVTKKFYDAFKRQRDAFQLFLHAIPDEEEQRWYTAVLIHRLMFVWFLQEKGFLDNDPHYLHDKLNEHLDGKPKQTFYRSFLCPLFFQGFAQEHDRARVTQRFGKIPYLNGGLFLPHALEEKYGATLDIQDQAFTQLFAFFGDWDWHLDDRPIKSGKEINPDVLGYIFEKYVNQKQMGAYYTKEDITEYISKNTIIPHLLDKVRRLHKAAFDSHAWKLLAEEPDRYIYPAMRHGVWADSASRTLRPLPDEIEQGVDTTQPRLLERRAHWNKPAPEEFALPTETWREFIARRTRYLEVRKQLASGEVCDVADLITLNLDIRQFAQDVIERCTDLSLLRAFWTALAGRQPRHSNEKFQHGLSVLDPTCGSGAFLFAALQILQPLYDACLTAMNGSLLDADPEAFSDNSPSDGKLADLKDIVRRFADSKGGYAVIKHIIVHNLYGVDIEEQAVEIAKLRLFLKLVSLLEPGDNIEPLPDIDFNIRAGNTLVGYATAEETERAVQEDAIEGGQAQKNLLFTNAWQDIRLRLAIVREAFNNFQLTQAAKDGHAAGEDKQQLKNRLTELEEQLNEVLAREYGVNMEKPKEVEKWKASHQPFHWYVNFYSIMELGGFDVVIGNPPYVEYSKIKKEYVIRGYETEPCGNLYAFVIELCFTLLSDRGYMGMIVQLPIVCTDRMITLQRLYSRRSSLTLYASYDDRPSRLFEGLEHIRATIAISKKHDITSKRSVFSSKYQRWHSEARQTLFELAAFSKIDGCDFMGAFPKIGEDILHCVWSTLKSFTMLGLKLQKSGTKNQNIYFHNAPQYWIRAMTFAPYFWNERDGEQISTQVKTLRLDSTENALAVAAILNSSLFYWWFIALSDCRHLNMREIERLPLSLDKMQPQTKSQLGSLAENLMEDLRHNLRRKEANYKTTGKVVYDEFFPRLSKPIIDQIDKLLAQHYGFSEEELDYIINYDIKYRMGREANDDEPVP